MKRANNPVIPDYRPKAERTKEEEITLKTCMVCKKATQGYGSFNAGYVCSRKCNDTYMANRPSLIDYQGATHAQPQVLPGTRPDSGDEPDASEGGD